LSIARAFKKKEKKKKNKTTAQHSHIKDSKEKTPKVR